MNSGAACATNQYPDMPAVNTSRGRLWIADHRRQPARPAALFIHGAGGSHLSFPAALRRMPSISPILVDLPGHGSSPGAGRASIAEYALDIVALLDALAIDSAIMLGHSMGGAIAQWLALEHAARVDALMLAGTGARLSVNPALTTGIIDDPDVTINSLVRWMWAKQAPEDLKQQSADIMLATAPSAIQADFMACDSFDASRRLAEIAVPALILAGDSDKMTPLSLSRELARGIAGSELAVIPNAGHMMLMEQPDHSAGIIAAWLERALAGADGD